MNEITPEDVKIKNRWFLRFFLLPQIFIFVFISILVSANGGWPFTVSILSILTIILTYYHFWTKFFKIQFGSGTILIQQGIISRRSTQIPYNKIENVIIERDIFDRMFGTSRVVIDNFGMGKTQTVFGMPVRADLYSGSKNYSRNLPGVRGERLFLPGILPASAEKIKQFVLAKQNEFSSKPQ